MGTKYILLSFLLLSLLAGGCSRGGKSSSRRPAQSVSAFYVLENGGQRTTLLLNGAHGFRQTRFLTPDSADVFTGEWRQVSPRKVVLHYREKNGAPFTGQKTFRFHPQTGQLHEKGSAPEHVYRKEYLM